MAVLLDARHHWQCPECFREHVTSGSRPHTPMHRCPKLRGAWAPFVPAGVKSHLIVNEREDYVGADLVQTNGEGRPVMSITTERLDGEDVTIFAPCATAIVEGTSR